MYIHQYRGERHDVFADRYESDPRALIDIDADEAARLEDTITTFYTDHLAETGLEGYVVGLSGGIDSTVTAHLLVEAVGAENVFGVIMPTRHTRQKDVEHAEQTADELGIEVNEYETFRNRIDTIVNAIETIGRRDHTNQKLKRGNILSRTRMIVLRDYAKAHKALVAGTTNASERDLGYMTMGGDGPGGVDNEGLYELYKITERQLAEHLGVDEEIIYKEPTADLWKDQRDTDELEFPYAVIDQVLVGLRLGFEPATISGLVDDVEATDVVAIQDRCEANAFKREPAPHPSL